MINPDVKKLADSNDFVGLHYIFVDSLDADPTFQNYIDSYEYCKQKAGFFEEFQQITPLKLSPNSWNMDYWYLLKKELLINFSEKRFSHMRKVAEVIFSEKIKKLEIERQQKRKSNISNDSENFESKQIDNYLNSSEEEITYSISDEEIARKKLENERIRQDKLKEERLNRENQLNSINRMGAQSANNPPKKALWITVAITIVILVLGIQTLLQKIPQITDPLN